MRVELYILTAILIVFLICSIIYFVKNQIKKHLLNKRSYVDYTLVDKDGVIYFDNEETITNEEFISRYNDDKINCHTLYTIKDY